MHKKNILNICYIHNITNGSKYMLNNYRQLNDASFDGCIGYVRKSSSSQKSIEEQITCIKDTVKKDGFKYIAIFESEGSGWKVNNFSKLNGFKNMVNVIKYFYSNNINIHIYIYDVSRFMRNVLIATKYINDVFDPYECTIHSIIDNKIWSKNNVERLDFLRELIEAEKFSVLLSNKIKKNIIYRKSLGHHIGSIKYGYERYKDNNIMKLRKNKKEQNVLGYIKKTISNKKYVVNKENINIICKTLNENNILKRGNKWKNNMINYIIKNNLNNVKSCNLNIEYNYIENMNNLRI